MQDGSDPEPVLEPGGNGRGGMVRLVDRSHLLRRAARSPAEEDAERSGIRLRRERRVSGTFSGIPALARTADDGS